MTPLTISPAGARASHGRPARRRRPLARGLLTVVVALTAAAGLAACDPPVDITVAGPAGLYPTFERDVSDYVNRCDPGQPTPLDIDAPEGTTVSINGSTPRGGSFRVSVNQRVGSDVTIALRTDDRVSTHHLRCLPADFPEWRATRSSEPQASYYVTNVMSDAFGPDGGYPVIFDNRGVPVWWTAKTKSLVLNPLPGATLGQLDLDKRRLTVTRLDGTVARTAELPAGFALDNHELELLANGNTMVIGNRDRPCDLTSWGLTGPRNCIDHTLLEFNPAGELVWSWDAAEHIDPTQTPAGWLESQKASPTFFGSFDNLHINSIDEVPGGLVLSFRHLNAIVHVDKATGAITWKLGGTPTPQSLRIVGDPFDGPHGQHDARVAGGVLSLFDNGTDGNNPAKRARSTSYALDLGARTATLIRDTRDEIAPSAFCCGSSRVLPGGNVVTGWGGSSNITENAPDGTRVFELNARSFVYRALPLSPGEITIDQLRSGMDAQFKNGRL